MTQENRQQPSASTSAQTLERFLTLDDLRHHLKDTRYESEWLFQVYVIQKRAFFFSMRDDGVAEEMQFRRDFSKACGVTVNEISLVGSAQVGFSVKPQARFRRFDEEFAKTGKLSDKSDIDVAVVSRSYFDRVHASIAAYTDGFKNSWRFNAYYPVESRLSRFDVPRADYQFYQYLARGWIRPDFAPTDFRFDFEERIAAWRKKLDRKVAVGIYRDWQVLRDYQMVAFDLLRKAAVRGEL